MSDLSPSQEQSDEKPTGQADDASRQDSLSGCAPTGQTSQTDEAAKKGQEEKKGSAEISDWLARLDKEMAVDPWAQLHWRMALGRQIALAKEGMANEYWSREAFADWLTGWAAEDRAAQAWPLCELDWLIKNGARIEEGPADALMIGGARSGRLDWLAKGWARETAREAQAAQEIEAAPADPSFAANGSANEQKDTTAEAGVVDATGSEKKSSGWRPAERQAEKERLAARAAQRGGWRWARDQDKTPHEKRKAEHGHMRSPLAAAEIEEQYVEADGSPPPGTSRHAALRAAWAAARAGQKKSLAWIAQEALPIAGELEAWETVFNVARESMRPQALEWIAGALDDAESGPPKRPTPGLPGSGAGAASAFGSARGLSRRSIALEKMIARSSHRQCSIFLNLALAAAPKEWSGEEKRAWLSGGKDSLLDTLRRKIDGAEEGAKIASRLVQKGWRWEASQAMETAMLQTRRRGGIGMLWRGITWPDEDAGSKTLKIFNISIRGQEARLACCAMASASPSAIAKWAFEPDLGLVFDKPAEGGQFAGKTALEVARERLDTQRLDPFRSGEIEALREAIARMESLAIRTELDDAKAAAENTGPNSERSEGEGLGPEGSGPSGGESAKKRSAPRL